MAVPRDLSEMVEKIHFSAGAKEVWVCNESAELTFYCPEGQIDQSSLFPMAPSEF